MKILAITANYPHITNEYSGIFVKNTLQELAKLGNEIVVIVPQKFHKKKMPFFEQDGNLKVYRPIFMTYGAKNILGFNTIKLSHRSFTKCVMSTLSKIDFVPDVIYSHFLFPAGSAAIKVGEKLKKKVFCALGEDNILSYTSKISEEFMNNILNKIDLIIPNNHDIEKILKENFKISSKKIEVIYNGVDTSIFYPIQKSVAKQKLNLHKEEKIVLFVGNFEERKGPLRVVEACNMLNTPLKMIFIGGGKQVPADKNIIYKGKVGHDKLQLFLNACDVFVFPTKSEGMPNALLEAMACSCNIVASDIDVNRFVLQKYSTKQICEATDINAIADGIKYFLESKDSQSNLFDFTLEKRARKIEQVIKKAIACVE